MDRMAFPNDPIIVGDSLGNIVCYILRNELNSFLANPTEDHIFVDAVLGGQLHLLENEYLEIYSLTRKLIRGDEIDESRLEYLVNTLDLDKFSDC